MRGARLRSGAYALTAALGLLAVMSLGAGLFTITAHTLKSAGEGWNAYHIADVYRGAPLYPPAASLFINNDPPLSFLLASLIQHVTLDAVIAGRVLAFVSTIGTGLALVFAARALGAGPFQSLLAAILFWASPWVAAHFSALNDPQMLGNFLDALGLCLILRQPRTLTGIALSAFCLAAALFVKPLFAVLPLALLVWLLVFDRRNAALFAGFGVAFSLIFYGLTSFVFHIELLSRIFSPRAFAWFGQSILLWLLVEGLPFLAALSLFRVRRESFAFFAAIYSVLAVVSGAIFTGFDGGSGSGLMDATMAVALGSALYLSRTELHPWSFPALGLAALIQGAVLVAAFLGAWMFVPSLPELMSRRSAVLFDMLSLKRHAGPALCEMPSLCYWADKPASADIANLIPAFQHGARPSTDLTTLFAKQYFSMIQIEPNSPLMAPSPLWPSLVGNYYLDHQDRNGIFLIPRSNNFPMH